MRLVLVACSLGLCSLMLGCVENAVLIPNSDSTLNKKAIDFATEAKASFPYPAELQKSRETMARAEVGYMWNVINLVNFSGSDWERVEIWLNGQYVLPLAKLETSTNKRLPFKMFYNEQGTYFPLGGTMIDKIEIKHDGVMYEVPMQIGGR